MARDTPFFVEGVEETRVLLAQYTSELKLQSLEKYPAKQHAQRVVEKLGVEEGLIYLPGAPVTFMEDSDQPIPFRQRRYFYYITGVNEADCHATYDIATDNLTLYITPVDLRGAIYNGRGPSKAESLEKYDIDNCYFVSELPRHLKRWAKENEAPIYILHENQKPDTCIKGDRFNIDTLQRAMDVARVIKDAHEIELIRKANKITAVAHRKVLKNISSFKNERQVSGLFVDTCVSEGAPNQAYEVIAASGENASTLHYIRNDEPLEGRQLMCLDAGCEYECYASDVTRTFPLSGSWPTKEAKNIYDLVQKMQNACVSRMGPGVRYLDLHVIAHKTAIEGLLDLGIFHHGSVDEIFKAGTSQAFYPHGLGHHVGLEVHDVLFRELLQPEVHSAEVNCDTTRRSNRSNVSFWESSEHQSLLEVADSPYGAILEENMVLTVEPGIYFSRLALKSAYLNSPIHSKYINTEVLERYLPVGGVRVEDNYLITAKGNENLTLAPKADEMLRIINGEDVDFNYDEPYCPIRGRPEQLTIVDTKDIQRSSKRRLASLQYVEKMKQQENFAQIQPSKTSPKKMIRKRHQAIVPEMKAAICLTPAKREHDSSAQFKLSKSSEPIAGNSRSTLPRQFDMVTRSEWKNSTRAVSQDKLAKSQSHPQMRSGNPSSKVLPNPFKKAGQAVLDEETGLLIPLEKSYTQRKPAPNPFRDSAQNPAELNWSSEPSLFYNFTASNIPPKLPEIPEKPFPYRRSTNSLCDQRHTITKSNTTPSASLDNQDRLVPECTSNEIRPTNVFQSAQTMLRQQHQQPTLYQKMKDAPLSQPFRCVLNHTLDHNRIPGLFQSPVSAPDTTRNALKNRQSMPVLKSEVPVMRTSSYRYQQGRGSIQPSVSVTNPVSVPLNRGPVTYSSLFPYDGIITENINARNERAARFSLSPNSHFRPTSGPDSTLTSAPLSSSSEAQSRIIKQPTSRMSTASSPTTSDATASPRQPVPISERPPLEPWWLVQAAGELRRKHPRTPFSICWSVKEQCWKISCTICCVTTVVGNYKVGPGQTLDEFENHLWMKHSE